MLCLHSYKTNVYILKINVKNVKDQVKILRKNYLTDPIDNYIPNCLGLCGTFTKTERS